MTTRKSSAFPCNEPGARDVADFGLRLPERRWSWPAQLPFYYGWVNVVVAALAMSATLPGRTYGLGLIKEPLRADLGISDFRFNALSFWAIVLGAIIVLPIGRLIDQLGTRTTLVAVAGVLGGCVLLMSWAWDELILFVTLTLVRGLGQGALSVVSIALVGKWFKRRAGPAMGVFTVLLAFGFVGPIFLIGAAVKEVGWRLAWAEVGYALLLGLVPLGWLLARSSPELCGITPDEPDLHSSTPTASVSLQSAMTTPAFWAYTLSATLFNFVFSALTLDNEALLVEHGLDGRQVNDLILGILMVSGLPANLVAGWLGRHRPMGKLLAGGGATLALSLVLFPSVRDVGMASGYATLSSQYPTEECLQGRNSDGFAVCPRAGPRAAPVVEWERSTCSTGRGAGRLRGAYHSIAIAVQLAEDLGRADKLPRRDDPVTVAVHRTEPRRPGDHRRLAGDPAGRGQRHPAPGLHRRAAEREIKLPSAQQTPGLFG